MKALSTLAIIAVLAAGNAYAGCTYPTPPDKLPNGATASMEEMVTAQKAVKEFDRAINAYTECLKLEADAAIAAGGPDMTDDQKKELERVHSQKHNAAVEADEALAARFNEQLKAYKEKSKK